MTFKAMENRTKTTSKWINFSWELLGRMTPIVNSLQGMGLGLISRILRMCSVDLSIVRSIITSPSDPVTWTKEKRKWKTPTKTRSQKAKELSASVGSATKLFCNTARIISFKTSLNSPPSMDKATCPRVTMGSQLPLLMEWTLTLRTRIWWTNSRCMGSTSIQSMARFRPAKLPSVGLVITRLLQPTSWLQRVKLIPWVEVFL